ncbi:hypothetical protein F511_06803 [Dorcoceras hygrometricum]|uniref:Uncharacterized protein n=1 Tax=Dorcoceras hygrometricum TaxID=472368 RepID=A0A2Z7CF14_9LAMI|nr:hypothetical protein F511_06803 [Dorcoceras hygrometricum]
MVLGDQLVADLMTYAARRRFVKSLRHRFDLCCLRFQQLVSLHLLVVFVCWCLLVLSVDVSNQLLRDVFKEDLVFDFEHQIPYLAKYFPRLCSSLRTLGRTSFLSDEIFVPSLGLSFHLVSCIAVVDSYQDARASGNTALSSPCWDRYPPCAEWLTTTVHGRGNDMLSCLMHLVFGCCITASGSLPHCEHTPWPLLLQILGAVLEFLSSIVGNPGFTAGRGFNPAGGAPGGG